MQDWGYEVFATLLLPGAVLALAGWLVLSETADDSPIVASLETAAQDEWKFIFGIGVASTLFGHVLAAIAGWIEAHTLDRWSARQLEIDDDTFVDEWNAYVDWLSVGKNSFVSRTARSFWFQSRMGLATSVLAATLFWWPPGTAWMTVSVLAVAAALLFLCGRTHLILGEWRHRNAEAGLFKNETARGAPENET